MSKRGLRLNLRIYNRDVTFLPGDDFTAQIKKMFYKMLDQQLNQVRY